MRQHTSNDSAIELDTGLRDDNLDLLPRRSIAAE